MGENWDAVRRVAAAYGDATRAGDTVAIAALSEPDAVVWHNYDDTVVGAESSSATLAWLHRRVPDISWEDVAVLPTPEGFLWRAVVTGTAPGGPIRAHSCMVVTLSEAGRVARVDEYLDPAAMAALARPT